MNTMKNFFKFLYEFVRWIVMSVLYVFRIPLAIVGIALLVGIFNKQAMFCILSFDFGVVVMAMPAFFAGKALVENITVFRKGERFSGTCTGYKLEHWNCGYDVCWIDSRNVKHYMRFDVPMIRFKFPCTVNVYTLNRTSNLGIFTVIKNVVCFVICILLWIGCTGITVNDVYNSFVYG